jgi:hypothetical protein
MSDSNEPPEAQKWTDAGGFLTDDEKRLLRGSEVDNESQKRYRVRYKTLGALNDLFMVGMHLSDKDTRKLFEGAGNITTDGATRTTADGERDILPGREGELSAIIALGARGYNLNGISPDEFISTVVRSGIQKGLGDVNGIHPNRVSVDIETDITVHDNLSELADRLEQEGPDALTEREAWSLYHDDRISLDEYTRVLEEINQ